MLSQNSIVDCCHFLEAGNICCTKEGSSLVVQFIACSSKNGKRIGVYKNKAYKSIELLEFKNNISIMQVFSLGEGCYLFFVKSELIPVDQSEEDIHTFF